jgi:enterochelin esterase-like enzyme
MPGRRLRLGAVLGLVVVGLLAGAAAIVLAAAGHRLRGRPTWGQAASAVRVLSISCRSPALAGSLPALVYLPPGYGATGRRYRVVYFLHGLPAGRQSYLQNAFVAAALVTAHQPAIVVAPQGARDQGSDREYLDWSPTEDWPRAISDDLTACVDKRFPTVATRRGRMLVGLSAGGYGAFNVGLRNLSTFGAIESWSGYFVATDPSGNNVLQLGSAAAQQAARVPRGAALAEAVGRWPSLIAFYVGRADDRFLAMNQAYADSLRRSRIAHVFRTYAGGHAFSLWNGQAPGWLTMGLTYLSTGRTTPPRAAG